MCYTINLYRIVHQILFLLQPLVCTFQPLLQVCKQEASVSVHLLTHFPCLKLLLVTVYSFNPTRDKRCMVSCITARVTSITVLLT